jgi:hypothetical protein
MRKNNCVPHPDPLPQGERRIRVEKFFKGFLHIDGGGLRWGEKINGTPHPTLSRRGRGEKQKGSNKKPAPWFSHASRDEIKTSSIIT